MTEARGRLAFRCSRDVGDSNANIAGCQKPAAARQMVYEGDDD